MKSCIKPQNVARWRNETLKTHCMSQLVKINKFGAFSVDWVSFALAASKYFQIFKLALKH
jgi:hypothetical protein